VLADILPGAVGVGTSRMPECQGWDAITPRGWSRGDPACTLQADATAPSFRPWILGFGHLPGQLVASPSVRHLCVWRCRSPGVAALACDAEGPAVFSGSFRFAAIADGHGRAANSRFRAHCSHPVVRAIADRTAGLEGRHSMETSVLANRTSAPHARQVALLTQRELEQARGLPVKADQAYGYFVTAPTRPHPLAQR